MKAILENMKLMFGSRDFEEVSELYKIFHTMYQAIRNQ